MDRNYEVLMQQRIDERDTLLEEVSELIVNNTPNKDIVVVINKAKSIQKEINKVRNALVVLNDFGQEKNEEETVNE